MMPLPECQKYDDMFIRLDTIQALDRQTGRYRQTDGRICHITISRSACIVCWRAIKTKHKFCSKLSKNLLTQLILKTNTVNIGCAADFSSAITSCAGGRHSMPHPLQVDLWPFGLESGVRITGDVGYLFLGLSVLDLGLMCATDAHHHLVPPAIGTGA